MSGPRYVVGESYEIGPSVEPKLDPLKADARQISTDPVIREALLNDLSQNLAMLQNIVGKATLHNSQNLARTIASTRNGGHAPATTTYAHENPDVAQRFIESFAKIEKQHTALQVNLGLLKNNYENNRSRMGAPEASRVKDKISAFESQLKQVDAIVQHANTIVMEGKNPPRERSVVSKVADKFANLVNKVRSNANEPSKPSHEAPGPTGPGRR